MKQVKLKGIVQGLALAVLLSLMALISVAASETAEQADLARPVGQSGLLNDQMDR